VLADTGIVVIAKNEGQRFRRCLASLAGATRAIVYADSRSTDGSVEFARSQGIEVVVLDAGRPTTQPRGRTAGFARLLEVFPEVSYVFFVDGDCELVPGFLEAAQAELEQDPKLAAVCGRRRELHPDATIYNRLVEMEWNTPVERDRLRFILKAKAVGLSLSEIQDILTLREQGVTPCTHVLAVVEDKLRQLDQHIRALAEFKEELATLRREALDDRPADGCVCSLIERHESRHELGTIRLATQVLSHRPVRTT
jgi:DNA-binding transcriptional MerR regulator